MVVCYHPEIMQRFPHIIVDNLGIFLYNEHGERNIDRTAILTDIADYRRGMQYVVGEPTPTVWAFFV